MTDANILNQTSDRSGPIGRILRFTLGAYCLWLLSRSAVNASLDILIWSTAVVLGLIAYFSIVHFIIMKFQPNINKYLGAILAFSPPIAVFMLLGTPGYISVFGFIGGSLILDAVTAGVGCEVMAIPNFIFHKRAHLVCPLFSPIDSIEKNFLNKGDAHH